MQHHCINIQIIISYNGNICHVEFRFLGLGYKENNVNKLYGLKHILQDLSLPDNNFWVEKY